MAPQGSIRGTTDAGENPIACTLDLAGFATQSKRWAHVLGRAAIERVETENGIRVDFRTQSGVEPKLCELVALESECCSWAAWTVDISGDRVVLRVTSTGDGVVVIKTMFADQPGEAPATR